MGPALEDTYPMPTGETVAEVFEGVKSVARVFVLAKDEVFLDGKRDEAVDRDSEQESVEEQILAEAVVEQRDFLNEFIARQHADREAAEKGSS